MITFLNHASIKISHDKINLIMDPYLSGSAFNNGWNLITEENHDEQVKDLTHIWFSHEHPDHFSIDFLKSIPEKKRRTINILFQQTLDKRVISFCNKMGFSTTEMIESEYIFLAEDFKIMCGKIPYYDSWLYLEYDNKKILNCNDCVLDDPKAILNIKKYISKTDILLTQFSYANWYGNREDNKLRSYLAKEKLNRIKMQCDEFEVKYVIPFASFIFFSHEENFYMNDEINDVSAVNEYILGNCKAIPIIMKPNEKWDGRSIKNNILSLDYWESKYASLKNKTLNQPNKEYNLEEIRKISIDFLNRIKNKNNMFLIRILELINLLKPVYFYISDQNIYARFTWKYGFQQQKKIIPEKNIVKLHSESLIFLIKYDFGLDTLNVNARFEATIKSKRNMIRTFFITSLNNTGRYFTIRSVLTSLNKTFIINGLKTVGLIKKRDTEIWIS